MAQQSKQGKNTSIGIDQETSTRLELFCKKYGIDTKKDGIIKMLDYFERTGVSPHTNEVVNDLADITEKLDAVMKLQADANLKLTNVQQITGSINQHQEKTSLLLENKSDQEQAEKILSTLEEVKQQTAHKKRWWQR